VRHEHHAVVGQAEQARLLGLPDYRMVLVPHPVQLLSTADVRALADAAFGEIVASLLA